MQNPTTNPISTAYSIEPLWNHQTEAIQSVQDHVGFGFFMGMGSGKTLAAFAYARHIGARNVLIVCPSNILHDGLWLDNNIKLKIPYTILNLNKGSSSKKGISVSEFMADDSDDHLVITNYRSIWRDLLGVEIRKIQWDLIICDEIQHIKSAGSKQSKYMATMNRVDRSSRRLGLTGTVIHDSPLDVYGVFRFLNPSVFGTRYADFQEQYAVMITKGARRFPVGYRNLDKLRAIIARYGYYVESEDVLDLPDEVHITHRADLDSKLRKAYDQLNRDNIAIIDGSAITLSNVLVSITRSQQMTSGFLPADDGTMVRFEPPKIQLMMDVIDKLPRIISDTSVKHVPFIVVYRFNIDKENILEQLGRMGISHAEYSGNIDALDKWKRGEKTALVAQYSKVKEGINLTRSTHMILYSKLHSYGDYQQLLKRIRRPVDEDQIDPNYTQPRDRVYYHHLVVRNSIDETIEAALKDKKDVTRYILDNIQNTK